MKTSRRTLLLAGAGSFLAACGSSSSSPGSGTTLQGRGGAAGTLVSDAMNGARTGWTLTAPENHQLEGLPVVIALHGRGGDHTTGLRALKLQDAMDDVVRETGTPFALATVDGGDHSYYHRRADGTDVAAMIRDDLVRTLGRHVDVSRIGLYGWSMGGYGTLLLAAQGTVQPRAVAVSSPALFTAAGSTPPGAFDDAEDFARHDVFAHPEHLDGVPVHLDCGRDDPFHDATRTFAGRLTGTVETRFPEGGHDAAYWRRAAPAALRFLAGRLD